MKITVLNLPELSADYRVDNHGNISMVYLGKIEVNGKTVLDIQENLLKKLKEGYLTEPQVTVEVKEVHANPISVIGAVKKPGPITDVITKNLVQIIALAGGLTDNAGNRAFVLRTTDTGETNTLEIDLDKLMASSSSAQLNIPIFSGDTINIPVDKPIKVYVLGEIKKPGEHEFSRMQDITILQAIAKAGGFTIYAKTKYLYVKRVENGTTIEHKVKFRAIKKGKVEPFQLMDNDVVLVR